MTCFPNFLESVNLTFAVVTLTLIFNFITKNFFNYNFPFCEAFLEQWEKMLYKCITIIIIIIICVLP